METTLPINPWVASMLLNILYCISSPVPYFLLFLLALSHPLKSQVTFSEVMNNPATSEANDEFIELYNSSPDSINLNGWFLDDSLSSDAIIDVGQGMVLAPQQFAIILDGSYFGNSSTYDTSIPDSALILRIADKAFGKNGLSNSMDRRLSLWTRDSILSSRYKYHATYPPGHSNEKRILSVGNDPANWQQSLVFGGTPGYRNSVSPYVMDLGFGPHGITWLPASIVLSGQQEYFTLTIVNAGLKTFDAPYEILLFADGNGDSILNDPDLKLYRQTVTTPLESQETLEISFSYSFSNSGRYQLVAVINAAKDQNPVNNKIYAEINILDNSTDIKLSEIKFLTVPGEPEWIEIYNNGDKRLSLLGWGLADKKDTTWIDSSAFIAPGQWKVLAAARDVHNYFTIEDSLVIVVPHFITLNNDGDTVYLLTPAGGWQEQVSYFPTWLEGEDGHKPSLERIRYDDDARIRSNWGPCMAQSGATPGRANSLQITGVLPYKGRITVAPNPFSPDGDGFEDNTLIRLQLPTPTARIRVEIYDLAGRRIRMLKENNFSGSRDKLIWNGMDETGRVVRMGIYIIYLQVIDDLKGVLRELRTPVVVAGQL